MKTRKHLKLNPLTVALATAFYIAPTANAVLINEDFTKDKTTQDWYMPLPGGGYSSDGSKVINSACLTSKTAGSKTATGASAGNPGNLGSPGKCDTGATDESGQGALRLTPAQQQKVGGIVSGFTFPTNDGVDISFTTYTWGGTGADGMAFFLVDADRPASLGGSGGSLGYSCSNLNMNVLYNGVDGAYLGIGMDEFGNFLNGSLPGLIGGNSVGDNTNTGPAKQPNGSNRNGWNNFPNTIGIRGKGIVSYNYLYNNWLQDIYTAKGWGTVPANKVNDFRKTWWQNPVRRIKDICKNGADTIQARYLPDGQKDLKVSDAATEPEDLRLFNYKYLSYKQLDSLWTRGANSREQATPIQYRIRIDKTGKGSVWYAKNGGTYQPVMLEQDLVKINGSLPKNFRFGFMGSTGGSHNNHEVTCFKASSITESEGNLSINNPDAEIVTDTQLYLSKYNNYFWTGQLQAFNLLIANGNVSVSNLAAWDAACRLDGGSYSRVTGGFVAGLCESTGKTGIAARDYKTRTLLSWNGASGINLNWNELTAAQKASLTQAGENETKAKERLEFLKGDKSKEATDSSVQNGFRARRSILGDIINSSPVWVGYPSTDYSTASFKDLHTGVQGVEATGSYQAFKNNSVGRYAVVYAGSNDGFLHAFRAGSHKADGSNDLTQSDGEELMAYMPSSVLQRIAQVKVGGDHSLDFTHEQYAHNYYNDAAVGTGDVYYNGQWHTLLLGGLGAGGDSIYLLDITNPSKFTAGNVLGEWSNKDGGVFSNMHNTYGTPVFGRFHNGEWGAVFGNGWCSTTDEANGNCTASDGESGIYVMTLDQNTGKPSFTFIGTGVKGTKASPNGIAYVTPIDIDGDKIYDYAYAGDIKGYVWRFDLNGQTATQWAAKKGSNLFETGGRPISSNLIVTQDKKLDNDVFISFGTGLRKNGYLGADDTYETKIQRIYGLRDRTATKRQNAPWIQQSQLLEQTRGSDVSYTENGQTVGTGKKLSTTDIDWTKHSGWFMNLGSVTRSDGKTAYEQIIYELTLQDNRNLLVNSYIDDKAATLTCDTTSQTGYTYPLNLSSGAGLKDFFTGNASGQAGSFKLDMSGSAQVLQLMVNGKYYLVGKDAAGNTILREVFPPSAKRFTIKRLSWREIY